MIVCLSENKRQAKTETKDLKMNKKVQISVPGHTPSAQEMN